MKVDNNLNLTIQRIASQNQEQVSARHAEQQISDAARKIMAESPIVMDAVEIKSILYLGIKGAVKLDPIEGQSIDTFA